MHLPVNLPEPLDFRRILLIGQSGGARRKVFEWSVRDAAIMADTLPSPAEGADKEVCRRGEESGDRKRGKRVGWFLLRVAVEHRTEHDPKSGQRTAAENVDEEREPEEAFQVAPEFSFCVGTEALSLAVLESERSPTITDIRRFVVLCVADGAHHMIPVGTISAPS